jgi:hypothetical protein
MDDALAALERLARLRDSGALTEEEFVSEKAKILTSRDSGEGRATYLDLDKDVSNGSHLASWMRTRRSKAIAASALLLLAAAAGSWWWFSPYWTLRDMQTAMKARDADTFSKYVDFASLRADLKADAFSEIAREAKASKGDSSDGFAMLGAAMVGPIIDGIISPDGLRALFAMRKPDGRDFGLMDAASGGGKVVRTGLSEFKVKGDKGSVLVFSLTGLRWRLSGMDEASARSSEIASTAATKQTAATPDFTDGFPSVEENSATAFGCQGAYSNVDFSSEDGDGSGVFAKVGEGGGVALTFWEGGPSVAHVVTTSSSADRLNLRITFDDDPGQTSTGSLSCRGNELVFQSRDLGHDEALRPITSAQEAELSGI